MKRLLFLLSAFAFAVSVSAQTPEAILDIIRQNPNFAEPTVTTYENIKVGKTTELYPIKDLVRIGDEGKPESNCDMISDIANSWVFLD